MGPLSEKWSLRHGALAVAGGVEFRVWAPLTPRLSVAIYGNKAQDCVMERGNGGVFHAIVPDVSAGCDYSYRFPDGRKCPDPVSRWQPKGVHGPSRVVDPSAFAWSDSEWYGPELRDLIIYELHTGAFTPEGTFEAIIGKLRHGHQLDRGDTHVAKMRKFVDDRFERSR